jgi:hypothetical protein
LIYSPKLKLLLFNIVSLVCDTLAPAVQKLENAAQEKVFWVPVYPLLNTLHHFLIITKMFSAKMLL